MKKFFLILLSLNTFFLFAQENEESQSKKSILFNVLRIDAQANVLQKLSLSDVSGKRDYDIGNTYSVGFEYVLNHNEKMKLGLGTFYQSAATIDTSLGKIGMIPVYAFIDFPLTESEIFPIQLTAQFGYSFLSVKDGLDKVNSGIYHALGITTVFSKYFQLKLLYAHNYGNVKFKTFEYSMRKENLTLAIYLKF